MSINLLSGQELFVQNTDKLKGSVKIMGKNYTTVYDNTTHRYRYFDETGKEIFLIKSFNEDNEEVNLSIEKNSTTESIEIIIDNNPNQVVAYKGGKDKLFGFFVGQVMKETQGKANPKSVNEILKKLLS